MKKTKIEWCDSTWNPVTGCFHGCEYCYARRIATRFGGASHTTNNECGRECQWITEDDGKIHDIVEPVFDEDRGHNAPYPFEFAPTFHRYRLAEPTMWTKPRTIFVCSMADLFGEWVPEEWIKDVFNVCANAPQHKYLFLTKNGERYLNLETNGIIPHSDNIWLGTSVTKVGDKAMWYSGMSFHAFVSAEPILEELHLPKPQYCPDWVIIGAETGNRKGRVKPERAWIESLVEECDREHIPVFMKESLVPVVGEENMRREFPWTSTENDNAD